MLSALGTLEWHGPHMPLGADGIQSKELFVRVAEKVGGVVLPMLFMGPDRLFDDRGTVFYGMDINTEGALNIYCAQQMKGSAYWMERDCFRICCAVFLHSFPEQESASLWTWTRSVNKCISGNEGRGRRKIRTVHYDSMDLCG